jgi:AcrR family transcriptional regulator
MDDLRAQRHKRMRNRILEAAQSLVVENGYSNLSLREIARRVDYSPAGLYEYFRGKDEIIDALCGKTEQRLAEALEAAGTLGSGEHPLVSMGLAYIDFALGSSDDFLLLFHRELPADHMHRISAAITAQVGECIDSGEFLPGPGFDEEEIGAGVWAMIHGAAMLCLTRAEAGFSARMDLHRENLHRLVSGLRG